MRKVGALDNEAQARVFSSYLVSLGIQNQIEQNRNDEWEIWVLPEEKLEEAEEELEKFRRDPAAVAFAQGAKLGQEKAAEERKEAQRSRTKVIDARTNLAIRTPPAIGFITLILIGISVVVFIAEMIPTLADIDQVLTITRVRFMSGGIAWLRGFPEVRHGQVWRLVTPIFLHGNFIHILFNMMWLRVLGSAIEYVEGSLGFILQVLFYAITSNIGQYLMSGPNFRGMSGVVYGLFGFVWICSQNDPARPYHIDRTEVMIIIGWAFLGLTGMLGPIANTAHFVGLAGGILWATATIRRIPFTSFRF